MKTKTRFNKLTAWVLSLSMLMAFMPCFTLGVSAATGTAGDLNWIFVEKTGTLTIYGSGTMNEYSRLEAPWYEYGDSIKTVDIIEGVTSIGSGAFYNCYSLTSITIPDR